MSFRQGVFSLLLLTACFILSACQEMDKQTSQEENLSLAQEKSMTREEELVDSQSLLDESQTDENHQISESTDHENKVTIDEDDQEINKSQGLNEKNETDTESEENSSPVKSDKSSQSSFVEEKLNHTLLSGQESEKEEESNEGENNLDGESSEREANASLPYQDFKGYYARFTGSPFASSVDQFLFIEEGTFRLADPPFETLVQANIQSYSIQENQISITGVEQIMSSDASRVEKTNLYHLQLQLDYYEDSKFLMDLQNPNRVYHYLAGDSQTFEQEIMKYLN